MPRFLARILAIILFTGIGFTSVRASQDEALPIKLGFDLELTGDLAYFGTSAKQGAELAISEINARGGVLGRQVEAVYGDNASNGDQAEAKVAELIDSGHVDVVIGCVSSFCSLAARRAVEKSGTPLISPAATNSDLTRSGDRYVRRDIFRTCFIDAYAAEPIVDFILNGAIRGHKAALLYDADSHYSTSIRDALVTTGVKRGLVIVGEEEYHGKSEVDFTSQLKSLRNNKFDVLIVPGYYMQSAEIANQARKLGITQPLVGSDGWDSPELWKTAKGNIEGSYFVSHFALDDPDPAVQQFVASLHQSYGEESSEAIAALTYDCVMLVADAIEHAGNTDHKAVELALSQTKDFQGLTGPITIDGWHNALKKAVVIEIVEGGQQQWVYSYHPKT